MESGDEITIAFIIVRSSLSLARQTLRAKV